MFGWKKQSRCCFIIPPRAKDMPVYLGCRIKRDMPTPYKN